MSTEDRLAIRELIDAYARCADRRDADGHVDWTEARTVDATESGE